MKVIGAGFGRTGTTSLKAALGKLGVGPCYHFQEVVKYPWHDKTWLKAHAGKPVDWQHFLRNYNSGLDYPICNFYKELIVAFPDAKVLLSVRDPDRWYDSSLATIYKAAQLPKWLGRVFPPMRPPIFLAATVAWDGIFEGRFEDRAHTLAIYERHIAEVKAHVPPERLLIFDVKEGWEPLCTFLNVPIPDEPFPHLNDRKVLLRVVKVMDFIGRYAPWAIGTLVSLTLLLIFNR